MVDHLHSNHWLVKSLGVEYLMHRCTQRPTVRPYTDRTPTDGVAFCLGFLQPFHGFQHTALEGFSHILTAHIRLLLQQIILSTQLEVEMEILGCTTL